MNRLWLVAGVVVVGYLALSAGGLFSFLSAPVQATWEDGSKRWVGSVVVNREDQMGFEVKGSASNSGSGTVEPKAVYRVYFTPQYNVGSATTVRKTYNVGVWPYTPPVGFQFEYWNLNAPSRSNVVQIKVCKVSSDHSIPLANQCKISNLDVVGTQNVVQFTDSDDGKGFIRFTGLGALQSKYDLPSTSDVVVFRSVNPASVWFKSYAAFLTRVSQLDCWLTLGASCISSLTSLPSPAGFYGGIENTQLSNDNSQVSFSMPSGLGSGVVQFEADADFFDSVFLASPAAGTPVVTSVSEARGYAGKQVGITAVVKNDADAGGVYFNVGTSTNCGSVDGQYNSVRFEARESKTFGFTLTLPNNPQTCSYTVQACNIEGACGSKSGQMIAEQQPVFPTNPPFAVCGNENCEKDKGESTANCPADCPVQVACVLDHEIKNTQTNLCECQQGFEYGLINNAVACIPPSSGGLPDWVWLVAGFVVVLLLLALVGGG